MIEDRKPERTPEPFRFEARVGGGRSPWPAAGIFVAFVILAIAKPWAPGPAVGSPRVATTSRPTPATFTVATARPSPSDGVEAVAGFCLEPGSWRTATIETWRDQTVRVWRALDPADASGPTDRSIPIVPAVGTSIPAIGYCAPGVGERAPTGILDVDAWRVEGGRASPLQLRQVDPVGVISPYGALYGPPATEAGDRASTWPDGVVVFRLAERASRLERWFAIEVRGVGQDAGGVPERIPEPVPPTSAAP